MVSAQWLSMVFWQDRLGGISMRNFGDLRAFGGSTRRFEDLYGIAGQFCAHLGRSGVLEGGSYVDELKSAVENRTRS